MSNYYSTSLGLILQNAGENSTTWGSFVNTNFQTLLEQAIVGQTTVAMTNADYTLTSAQGVSNEARNAVLIITGNQNATYNVIVPAVPKLYIITNSLNSSATAYFKVTGSSTSFSVANGTTVIVYCTGSNVGTAFYPVNYVGGSTASNFTVNGTLNVTGATALSSTLGVTGATTLSSTLGVTGATTLSSTLAVSGGSVLTGDLVASTATGNLYVGGSSGTYAVYNKLGYLQKNGGASELIVTQNSGTYGINISGNAATATTATSPASGGSFITSSNIGSQSVNYATTAGVANTLNSGTAYATGGMTVYNTVSCYPSDGYADIHNKAMTCYDYRIGSWSVGSGVLQVFVDSNPYVISITPSDESLKLNIQTSTYNALDKINQIKFKEFDYNPEKSFKTGHIDCGITSQQLETVDSKFVVKVENYRDPEKTLLQPDNDQLLYVAMKAIQELKAEVDSLKTEFAALKG